ncbi:AAA family ATPase [Paucibacter sp. R3-3]|uniref:AAA family ATPase n=1 Tax=Roseateles agri TaxID=3098619 RepID=A0ABU5DES4_9BURK|nr:AAA family ATPase [Paucibacter sp. R3-3]MDY0744785.1 AAA family ATPase [Paucibacter sp. R3-3]
MNPLATNKENEHAVNAVYTTSRIPRHMGNQLIEALPPMVDGLKLLKEMDDPPKYKPEQLTWPKSERMLMVDELSNFNMPLRQQVELFGALDRMIRAGYVGRVPRTPHHAAINQAIYEKQHNLEAFSQTDVQQAVQVSTSLIGVSGMGKTTTLKRWCARLPKVIFHESLNLYQVPYLHIELPADGASIRGLATAIFQALERLFPGSDYVRMYTKGRPNEEMMILSAARLMHKHCVGLLIVDEVQNLANSPKGAQVLMTQLTSICNVLGLPVLFVGTNKAASLLGVDFRQGRRSSGEGIPAWERLLPLSRGGEGEWEDFVGELWQYQWVQNPVKLQPEFRSYLYWACQGVVDLTIKMVKSAQIRAMIDGTERLSIELLKSVYEREFKVLHHMLDALRTNNWALLERYDDIRPLDFDKHLKKLQLEYEAKQSPLYSTKPTDAAFKIRLSEALISLGRTPEQADLAANHAAEQCKNQDMDAALDIARAFLKAEKPVRKKANKGAGGDEPAAADDPARFDANPRDYRRAYAHAEFDNRSVFETLGLLAMLPRVEELFAL